MKPVLLGAYRLIAKLGRGRLTDVYLATRAEEGSNSDLLVIKRLRRSGLSDSRSARAGEPQVCPDADLAALLSHPNIITTHELVQTDAWTYWVQEYVEGQPLDRIINAAGRAGGLPVGLALRIVSDLLSGLEYAHRLTDDSGRPLGIVHRDVRPHNVFVTYQGDVKLGDFGLPHPAPESDSDSELIRSSALRSKAPEQATSGTIDRRTDVFGVGQVLSELLARQRRSSAEVPVHTLQGLQPEITSEHGALRPDLTDELTRITERALEADPDRRYATAEEMQREVEQVLEQLDDSRNATPAIARANLGSFVDRMFKSERGDATRRIQLLLSVDGVSPTAERLSVESAPERASTSASAERLSAGPNGVAQPGLRLSQPARNAAAAGALRPQRRAEPSDGARRLALAQPEPTSGSTQSIAPARASNQGRRAASGVAALAILGAIGVTWLLTRSGQTAQSDTSAATNPKPPVLEPPVLRLCGSNTVGAELGPALVEGMFAAKDSSSRVAHKRDIDSDVSEILATSGEKTLRAQLTARGTATGFAGLADGTCDVAMASRAVDEAEAKRLAEQGLGDFGSAANEHVIGLDGVAVIVHPNNPVSTLDRQQLHAIFTGEATDWAAFGGKAGPIHVLARDDQSGTFDTFHHIVLADDKLTPSAKRYARSDALADAVASDPAAIGFVGLAYTRTAKAVAVGEQGAAPLLPTQFTVATEGYLLSRRLYLYTPDKPRTPWVSELVNFAMSAQGQEVAGKTGFVSMTLLTEPSSCTGDCSPRYMSTIAKAHRVSVDLRFRSGSDQPDSRARRDMDRLVSFLQRFREPKVLLLGFSDSHGSATENQRLSTDRAKTIAHELELRGIQAAVVTGFGAAMPVASNDTELGRVRNRRVEVWFEHL